MKAQSEQEKVTYSKLIHAHLRIEKLEKDMQDLARSRDCAYVRHLRFETALENAQRETEDLSNDWDCCKRRFVKIHLSVIIAMILWIPLSLALHLILWAWLHP